MTISLSHNSTIIRNSGFPPIITTVEIGKSVESAPARANAPQIQTIFSNNRSDGNLSP
jgi:hypothetical protein